MKCVVQRARVILPRVEQHYDLLLWWGVLGGPPLESADESVRDVCHPRE